MRLAKVSGGFPRIIEKILSMAQIDWYQGETT
jgi:hypothetical protein